MYELARVMEAVEKYFVVPDWPGSEVESIKMQAEGMVVLKGVREVAFESPEWREDNTFRGMPSFGMRVYEIRDLQMESIIVGDL